MKYINPAKRGNKYELKDFYQGFGALLLIDNWLSDIRNGLDSLSGYKNSLYTVMSDKSQQRPISIRVDFLLLIFFKFIFNGSFAADLNLDLTAMFTAKYNLKEVLTNPINLPIFYANSKQQKLSARHFVFNRVNHFMISRFGPTALRKWGGAHQTSNHLTKPHI